ncbi:hypothetical protein [Haloarcula amylovorans]|uniref:hypothetical protein n=1 Tax=Haloarcula amylovorans TaxID=2562280 RepID=UPI001075E2A0|nr:hypothetical protein [Halomicroarcula amylolytica]
MQRQPGGVGGGQRTDPCAVGVVEVVGYADEDPWGGGGIALRDTGGEGDTPAIVAAWASPADGVAVGRGADISRPPEPLATVNVTGSVMIELAQYETHCLARYSTDGQQWHRLGSPLLVPRSFRPTLVPFTATTRGTVRIKPVSLRQGQSESTPVVASR